MDFEHAIFYLFLVGCGVWMMYMIAFRPDEWERYCQQNKERNRKLLGAGLKVGRFAWRNYRR